MRDTIVTMKDGTVHEGPLWTFRPEEGWLELAAQTVSERLFFRDMISAVTKNVWITIDNFGTQDEIQRAKDNGWDGKS